MEYNCPYCKDWFDAAYCETHFSSVHGQEKVTFDALKRRLANIGGLDVRDESAEHEAEEERVFVTSNFRNHI